MSAFFELVVLQMQRRPEFLRLSTAVMTKLLPQKLASKVIGSAAQVRETFARSEDFSMGYLNAPKLKLGPFLLGMDPPLSEYAQEKQLLIEALQNLPNHIHRFAAADAERAAKELARTLPHAGSLELASGYAEPVFARALAHCFGVPAHGAPCPVFSQPEAPASAHGEPSEAQRTPLRWIDTYWQSLPFLQLVPRRAAPENLSHEPLAHYIRTFGGTIGSEHPAPFGLEARAQAATPYFRAHIEAAIRAHRDKTIGELLPRAAGMTLAPEDTIVGQLIARAPFADGDAGIVRCVAGMLSASASFPNAFASVLHELLARPHHLRGFAAAVRAHDEARALGYVREALRFRPPFPMLVRSCPNDTTLGSERIPFASGETVPFFPAAAMFDPALVDRPEEFNPQRPESCYFLFGGAPRECIGKALMLKLFLPMFEALFRHMPRVLITAPGQFVYEGPILDRYDLELGALLGMPSVLPGGEGTSVPPMPSGMPPSGGSPITARSDATASLASPSMAAGCPHAAAYLDAMAQQSTHTPSSAPEPSE